jgi:hypothetical protein
VNVAQALLPRVAPDQPTVSDVASARAGVGRAYWWWLSLAALIAAVVPGLAYANCILNHFYLQGAYFWDSGVVAGAIWRRDAWLTYPPLWPVGSLYAYHVMPLLSGLTLASRYLPIGLPGWFALVTGVGHAIPSIGVFWLLTQGLSHHTKSGLAVSVVLAVAVAFTGIPLATILFPHPEIILAGGLLLTVAAIALERYWIAGAYLVFTLLVREDAGFHAFSLIFLLMMANWVHGRPWREQQPLLILAAIGFLYSSGAVAFKQVVFPDQPSLFVGEYLGNPPFIDFSVHQVLLNVFGLPLYRGYVFWPAVAALVWAILSRNILILLGYLAFCPWLLLHLIASRDILNTLSGYYSFPFLVALIWPLAAVVIDARQRGVKADARSTLGGFTVMVALSFLGLANLWNPGGMDLWKNFTTPPSLTRERATDEALATLLAAEQSGAASRFGTLATDQSIYSLAPYSLDAAAVVRAAEHAMPAGNASIDTFAYFESGHDIERLRETTVLRALTHEYRFKNTAIRLRTDKDLRGMIGLEPALLE